MVTNLSWLSALFVQEDLPLPREAMPHFGRELDGHFYVMLLRFTWWLEGPVRVTAELHPDGHWEQWTRIFRGMNTALTEAEARNFIRYSRPRKGVKLRLDENPLTCHNQTVAQTLEGFLREHRIIA